MIKDRLRGRDGAVPERDRGGRPEARKGGCDTAPLPRPSRILEILKRRREYAAVLISLALVPARRCRRSAGAAPGGIAASGKNASWPVSRVLYGGRACTRPRDSHSSGAPVAWRLVQPTRTAARKRAWPCGRAIPIRSCSRWGLPCRPCCQARGALLPHPFTLAAGKPWRFAFCGTVPGVAPAGRYPAPCFRGARTFLSPKWGAATRPAGRTE